MSWEDNEVTPPPRAPRRAERVIVLDAPSGRHPIAPDDPTPPRPMAAPATPAALSAPSAPAHRAIEDQDLDESERYVIEAQRRRQRVVAAVVLLVLLAAALYVIMRLALT